MRPLKSLFYTCVLFLGLCLSARAQNKIDVKNEFELAAMHYELMLKAHQDVQKSPFSVHPDGTLKDMPSSWWCSGFFPGSLWYLYQFTKDDKWKKAAEVWTGALTKEQFNVSTHDLGFMLYCSFGNGYRLTENELYKKTLLQGASSLSSRFNPKTGLIKSWDSFETIYKYPVIIDNMMNLEYLFWAAKVSRNKTFFDIAISHADKTLKNHFRTDHSCYHVVCYDSTGKVLARKNHQGYNDASAWSRGQAWALYGYTVMYRETRNKQYLEKAEKIADYYLHHPNLPTDKIPYWDFNAPNIPSEEKDASAAAVVASALLELQQYSKKNREVYIQSAEAMLVSLSLPPYKAEPGSNNNFILKHSMGSKTLGKEVDQPLIYADYYYLEALLRYQGLASK
ncbi:glycoside hydrolase family 88 protein [Pedobacter nyackensis]|uniref:Glycosyl Hydrolase Family 88 n=1 Tax=Pedobacter nyackensis TaxID=475255 RepID=A0A1W2A8P9_9SPHI|nr:glycoside hydrolase family 88 protein [Pedobacter nyackensis]SMC57037.1 Glycosyl Hydrolase Family 88 [Pedobacter nyackensis]